MDVSHLLTVLPAPRFVLDKLPTHRHRNRFHVRAEKQLGETGKHEPPIGVVIARREAKRLVDVGLGLLAATEKELGETDEGMSVGQIVIQC